MAKIIHEIKPKIQRFEQKRVVAYARVSSEKDAMMHSLSAQIDYYSSLIESNPEWKFCGVYADRALTGTKGNRKNFQLMLNECRLGKVDLIITKSISRFARNTVTLLETVRELKAIGVDIYFEEQNIHTLSSDGELMLTILAGYAEEESLSASENQKWHIRRNFESGIVGPLTMLGYQRNSEGVLEIIPEEAEIVKSIFNDYLNGISKQKIVNRLLESHIPTKGGGEWTTKAIRRILQNEKYCGDLLLQKTFTENHLTKKKIQNEGQYAQYYVEDAHEPIIDRESFEKVQQMLEKERRKFTQKPSTAVYPFTGKIQCNCCGGRYRRKTTSNGIVWICTTYNTKGKKYCPTSKQIPEQKLESACCEALEIKKFDTLLFKTAIVKIIVFESNRLDFYFTDGKIKSTYWTDRSRSESWTPEMRQKAREKTYAQNKKNSAKGE